MLQVLGCRRPRAGVRGDDRVSRLRSRGGELGQTRAARVRAQAREHPEVPGLQVTVTVVVPQIDPSVKLYNHGEGPY